MFSRAIGAALVLALGCAPDVRKSALESDYDPFAFARTAGPRLGNIESGVPPMCYTATGGSSNPCWVCHTQPVPPNERDDASLQREYAFSDAALTNHWTNLFRAEARDETPEQEILDYLREDNAGMLARAIEEIDRELYTGYRPDLDFERGFDEDGFARDGSAWRALRYQPFPGTFWPTNGSSDDVFIRLPAMFRQDPQGRHSTEIYRINLSILEAAIAADPTRPVDALAREVEPLDETLAGVDLDRDGELRANTTQIRGLPAFYVGRATNVPVVRYQHPQWTEYLHTVRYVDPDAPDLRSRRVKELRYARRVEVPDEEGMRVRYEEEAEERTMGRVPTYRGSPTSGLLNAFGWQLQGFIEDAEGRLRLQTMEEHRFCMGCHTSLGVTIDSTFSLARKVPGIEGWRVQDLRGLRDVPQAGHREPEALTYFRRVGGADELRANAEMLARFWPNGVLDEDAVRLASSGHRDLAWMFTPSRERAIELARAYLRIVREQSFVRGRDAVIRPAVNVHRRIDNGDTELARAGMVFTDGRLALDWTSL